MHSLRLTIAATFFLAIAVCQSAPAVTVLMVTESKGSLNKQEVLRQTQLQSWGHTVTTIWDNDSQSNFDKAVLVADVAYIPCTVQEWELTTKLRAAAIGVICEERYNDVNMGFSSGVGWDAGHTQTEILNNNHEVTSGLVKDYLTIVNSSQPLAMMNPTVSSGMTVLSKQNYSAGSMLGVMETGAELANKVKGNAMAAARRVRLCWGGDSFDFSALNASGLTILRNAITWAAGKKLIAHWKLDETDGTTAADASGNGNNGYVSGKGDWTEGMLKGGFSFDGSNEIMVKGLLGSPKNISIAAWANLTTPGKSGSELISLGDCFLVRLDDGGILQAFYYDGSSWQSVSIARSYAGTGWHHFAATFDDDNKLFRLHVDGVEVASASVKKSISYSGLGSNTFIGRHGNGSTTFDFTGVIDDVRVYNYALTDAEVWELYGFIGHWKLGDGSGKTAVDSTPFAQNGKVQGKETWSNDCGGTGVFEFQGNSQSIDVADSTHLQPTESLTIAAWINGSSWEGGENVNTIVRKGDKDPVNYQLAIAEGRVALYLDAADSEGMRGNTKLENDTWYHVAATWDGTVVRLYVNGALDAEEKRSEAIGSDTRPLLIGGRSGGDHFAGMMRDVRLYGRRLYPAEIAELYGLVGHWKLDETAGNVAVDSSGLDNSGTVSGTTCWTKGTQKGAHEFDYTDGDDYISLPNTTSLENVQDHNYTLAAWFKPLSKPPGSGADNTAAYGILLKSGYHEGLYFTAENGFKFDHWLTGNKAASATTVSPAYPPGSFYHVAGVVSRTAGTVDLYVDGVLRASNSFEPESVTRDYGTEIWRIGIASPGGGNWRWAAHGVIDDARIYNRALCPDEILALYGSGSGSGSAPHGVRIIKWVEIR